MSLEILAYESAFFFQQSFTEIRVLVKEARVDPLLISSKGVDNEIVGSDVVAVGTPNGKTSAAGRRGVAGKDAVSGALRTWGDFPKILGNQLAELIGISSLVSRRVSEQRLCHLFQRGRADTRFGLLLKHKKATQCNEKENGDKEEPVTGLRPLFHKGDSSRLIASSRKESNSRLLFTKNSGILRNR